MVTKERELSELPPIPAGLDLHGVAAWPLQNAVILSYGSLGTLAKAADACNVPKTTAYHWENRDYLGFVTRLAIGRRMYQDYLENLVHDRLSDPTGNRGSDVLLMGALNANHPDKWSRNIQVTHEVGREVMATLQKIQEQQQQTPTVPINSNEPWKTASKLEEGAVEGSSEVVDAEV